MARGNIAVLGVGLVGQNIARTLAEEGHPTIAFDINLPNLSNLVGVEGLERRCWDVTKGLIDEVLDADVVIGALPDAIAYEVAKAVLKAGQRYVDIGFMSEDFRLLEPIAMANRGTAVVDFGVAPGLSNMFVGQAHRLLGPDNHASSIITVCGLPLDESRVYFAPFADATVFEEYERPARRKSQGMIYHEPPFERERITDVRGKKLSCFLNDGLRSLLHTIPISKLEEWTPRYKAHFDEMRRILATHGGEFPQLERERLVREWTMKPGDRDFTYLRVESVGRDGRELVQTLYDEFDESTGTHSMARTTGFPPVIMAKMIANGEVNFGPGIIYPELIGVRDDGIAERIVHDLQGRGIRISNTGHL